jgi:hypothetical protein
MVSGNQCVGSPIRMTGKAPVRTHTSACCHKKRQYVELAPRLGTIIHTHRGEALVQSLPEYVHIVASLCRRHRRHSCRLCVIKACICLYKYKTRHINVLTPTNERPIHHYDRKWRRASTVQVQDVCGHSQSHQLSYGHCSGIEDYSGQLDE